MKNLLKWLVDKWLAGFITATIFFILKIYYDLPKESKVKFFSFDWLNSISNYNIALKYVLLLSLIIIILTRIEKVIYKHKLTSSTDKDFLDAPPNNFSHFTSGLFGRNHSKWTWTFAWRPYQNKFEIENLKPSCKVCGTTMEIINNYRRDSTNGDCHKCRLDGKQYHHILSETSSDVEREIIRRVTNNEF